VSEEAPGLPGPAWWRKRPVTVQGIPWTGANAEAVTAFAGGDKFTPYAIVRNGELEVWNEQERHWLPCPVGHVVMRGVLGELYPVSPAALEVTFDPSDGPGAGRKSPRQAIYEAQHAAVRRRFPGIAEIRWDELSAEAQAEQEEIADAGLMAALARADAAATDDDLDGEAEACARANTGRRAEQTGLESAAADGRGEETGMPS
jgi:hypothetical protein